MSIVTSRPTFAPVLNVDAPARLPITKRRPARRVMAWASCNGHGTIIGYAAKRQPPIVRRMRVA